MADDLVQALDDAEAAVTVEVSAVLSEVADEFAAELADATELVAARFSVSRIARMFTDRMPRIVRRLLGVAEQAAETTAAAVDAELPDGWDDLPARYDDGTLPEPMNTYVQTTEHLLRAVGERLADVAVRELAAGVDAGEDLEALRARLREAFDREGAQLGETREERIARTEAGRAWNTATLEAARAVEGPDKPLVKQWITRRDTRVRDDHRDANGQLRLLDEPFTVGGVQMDGPHDPAAPASQVCNCRCQLAVYPETRASTAFDSQAGSPPVFSEARRRWVEEFRADQARQAGPPGSDEASLTEFCDRLAEDLSRRVLRPALAAAGVDNPDGYRLAFDSRPLPATRPASGRTAWHSTAWDHRQDLHPAPDTTAAADGSHLMGGMVALMPSAEDAERLALDGGEDTGELHCTMVFLGPDAADWIEDQRGEFITALRALAAGLPGPIGGHVSGAAHWNTDTDNPSWVWTVSDSRERDDDDPTIEQARNGVFTALEDTHNHPDLPRQHTPWTAHVCAAYTDASWPYEPMTERVGPVVFDRLRVAFGDDRTDIPLGPQQEEPMTEQTAAATEAATRTWSTPDDTALAFENQETGDGRIFAEGALYWDGPGPWPLQYADEMLMGHQGAQLAGGIEQVGRAAPRITGNGVLYMNQAAGQDAAQLLDEGAPLGVSVDLDDVDIEFVDRTIRDGDDEDEWALFATARLSAASVLRLEDGAYMLSASTRPQWSASATAASMARSRYDVQLMTGPDGQIAADTLRAALGGSGVLTAAAGDEDDPDGIVVWRENAGDFLMRITRARLRGATLVSMPAYANARIVLDPVDETAAALAPTVVASSADTTDRVVVYVCTSPVAVGARDVAGALAISMTTARKHLSKAADAGRLVKLAPGLYCGPSSMPEGVPDELALDSAHALPVDLEASAWQAIQDAPPLPAAWFREPTAQELPPGSGGVHYADGRVWGWVAQAGEPHAGFPGRKLTIESLGKIDLSHFLRTPMALDDGTLVAVGAFTMNVGHHRDGAECETDACQFDNSRTVAGIVTVGMSDGGMWFSGASAPWLSEWDRRVFKACQPSYHMRQQPDRTWQLRAVLTVPVPGHSSPLVAAAVAERANLALAASATAAHTRPDARTARPDDPSAPPTGDGNDLGGQRPDTASADRPDDASGPLPDAAQVAEAVVAALLADGGVLDQITDAVEMRTLARTAQREEIERLAAQMDPAITQLAAASLGGHTEGAADAVQL